MNQKTILLKTVEAFCRKSGLEMQINQDDPSLGFLQIDLVSQEDDSEQHYPVVFHRLEISYYDGIFNRVDDFNRVTVSTNSIKDLLNKSLNPV